MYEQPEFLEWEKKALIIVIIAVPIITLVIILIILINRNKKKKKYTLQIMAEVDRLETSIATFEGDNTSGTRVQMRTPVMKFELYGHIYETKNNSADANPLYKPGDKVEILIDPLNPTDGYIVSDAEFKRTNLHLIK